MTPTELIDYGTKLRRAERREHVIAFIDAAIELVGERECPECTRRKAENLRRVHEHRDRVRRGKKRAG